MIKEYLVEKYGVNPEISLKFILPKKEFYDDLNKAIKNLQDFHKDDGKAYENYVRNIEIKEVNRQEKIAFYHAHKRKDPDSTGYNEWLRDSLGIDYYSFEEIKPEPYETWTFTEEQYLLTQVAEASESLASEIERVSCVNKKLKKFWSAYNATT